MARVQVQAARKHTAPIERILGQNAQVTCRTPVMVNNFIRAEFLDLCFPENEWPEEHARLNLFPIADGKYYMHIMYLQVDEQQESARICWMEFEPSFFELYTIDTLQNDKVFRADKVTEQQFTICAQSEGLLEQLVATGQSPEGLMQNLKQTETAIQLLRRALECISVPFTVCPVPACRFLANDNERDKVIVAQGVIREHLDSPLTIKELSRKVAMNECYLKKGFKALTGKTIHEYTRELRIAKAKELLQEGQSVSDVANNLGYSSISHFSTAFKKATGTKPCELLQ